MHDRAVSIASGKCENVMSLWRHGRSCECSWKTVFQNSIDYHDSLEGGGRNYPSCHEKGNWKQSQV